MSPKRIDMPLSPSMGVPMLLTIAGQLSSFYSSGRVSSQFSIASMPVSVSLCRYVHLLIAMTIVVVIVRLRKHRGRLSSTLSSNGSSFSARRFLKLFIMSTSFLVIYLPVTIAFFYLNLPLPLIPYSWSRVHDPKSWNPVIYLTTASYGGGGSLQYYGWSPIAMGFFVFFYYGLNNEAIDMYRNFVGSLGFARIWPSLLQPREIHRRGSTSSTSWNSHFDLVSKAMHYFDGGRKHSQATSTIDGTRSEA
jgi:pheromone a factor receptor